MDFVGRHNLKASDLLVGSQTLELADRHGHGDIGAALSTGLDSSLQLVRFIDKNTAFFLEIWDYIT